MNMNEIEWNRKSEKCRHEGCEANAQTNVQRLGECAWCSSCGCVIHVIGLTGLTGCGRSPSSMLVLRGRGSFICPASWNFSSGTGQGAKKHQTIIILYVSSFKQKRNNIKLWKTKTSAWKSSCCLSVFVETVLYFLKRLFNNCLVEWVFWSGVRRCHLQDGLWWKKPSPRSEVEPKWGGIQIGNCRNCLRQSMDS